MDATVQRKAGQGSALVGWLAVLLSLMVLAVLALYGTGEAGLRAGIRATARSSCALLLPTFVASSLLALFPSPATKWLMRNRRALGVSFAVSMGLHAGLILSLASQHRDSFFSSVKPTTMFGGGLAFVFIALMAATSFDRGAALIGRKAWKVLHKTGIYFLWFIFTFSYIGRIRSPVYAAVVVTLLAALGLRVAAALRRRKRSR